MFLLSVYVFMERRNHFQIGVHTLFKGKPFLKCPCGIQFVIDLLCYVREAFDAVLLLAHAVLCRPNRLVFALDKGYDRESTQLVLQALTLHRPWFSTSLKVGRPSVLLVLRNIVNSTATVIVKPQQK